MKHKERIAHIIFWLVALILWAVWVQGRIEIFEQFIDNYKGIGYFVKTNDHQLGWYILISFYKGLLLLILIYRLIPRFGFSSKLLQRSLPWLIGMLSIEYLTARLYFSWMKTGASADYRLDWSYDFGSTLGIYLILLFLGVVFLAAKNWVLEYRQLKKLHQTQQSYERLKEQLNPHFLFNTINVFYDIAISEGNDRLQNGVLNLTKTLRYTIASSDADRVNLNQEIEAIQSFIDLQKDRVGEEDLDLVTTFQIEHPDFKIVPLILLNYVENAFAHGYRYGEESMIAIDIEEKENRLSLTIRNTNHARRSNEDGGNQKTKKLLDLNYPGKHQLDMFVEDNHFVTKLWIQLN